MRYRITRDRIRWKLAAAVWIRRKGGRKGMCSMHQSGRKSACSLIHSMKDDDFRAAARSTYDFMESKRDQSKVRYFMFDTFLSGSASTHLHCYCMLIPFVKVCDKLFTTGPTH